MVVRVWTIQRPSWWRTLQQRGLIHADGRRLCHDFRPAYNWMMGQMYRRIPGYTGAYPVWFWYSPKPDLRHSGHLARGERGLRIELELPRSIVLLSDFETWHSYSIVGIYLFHGARAENGIAKPRDSTNTERSCRPTSRPSFSPRGKESSTSIW